MKAIILAAGKGTRCLPLTKTIPKVLISLNGKPFLSYVLGNLQAAGFSEFGIIVGHLKEKVAEFIKENKINATLIAQEEQLGTGHALAQAEKFVCGEDFLLVSGDNLYSKDDISAAASAHGTVVAGFNVADPSNYGVLEASGENLKQILEKPENPPSNFINVGLYKLNSEIFSALKQIKKSNTGEYYLTDAINLLAVQGKVKIKNIKDYWVDLGRLEDIPRVELELKNILSKK
ncbi:MAG TPA: NTP transferase domain-containing protein [Nanoarchaeota archaeon]|nr:NTP transferase domain-containing protein [Nanoarchaeota archaeon]